MQPYYYSNIMDDIDTLGCKYWYGISPQEYTDLLIFITLLNEMHGIKSNASNFRIDVNKDSKSYVIKESLKIQESIHYAVKRLNEIDNEIRIRIPNIKSIIYELDQALKKHS